MLWPMQQHATITDNIETIMTADVCFYISWCLKNIIFTSFHFTCGMKWKALTKAWFLTSITSFCKDRSVTSYSKNAIRTKTIATSTIILMKNNIMNEGLAAKMSSPNQLYFSMWPLIQSSHNNVSCIHVFYHGNQCNWKLNINTCASVEQLIPGLQAHDSVLCW